MTAGRTNTNQTSQSWCTPKKYADAIHSFFNNSLDLDPCSNQYSLIQSKLRYCLPFQDGLNLSWNYRRIFVNPPYGKDKERGTSIKSWFRKVYESYIKYKNHILMLVPVATNTSHWKEFVYNTASAICFLYDTRLKFVINGSEDNKGAPMACCIIYYGNKIKRFRRIFKQYGYVVMLGVNHD